MCSICGIYDYEAGGERDVSRMMAALCHRGPDGSGEYHAGRVSLGHNRLAVRDPLGGAQPMVAEYDGNEYSIVYNGEIYNTDELKNELVCLGVRPKTACDTELVLWSYILFREECPLHLNGIFAFAVYDRREDSLFLARDRLGVKPLYYAEHKGQLYFASEVKGILAGSGMPAELDEEGLFELLYLSPVTREGSGVLRGIRQLLPAERAFITPLGMKRSRYWGIAARDISPSFEEAAEEVRALVTDATRRQLVSDVPLAAFLSGGLDSSVLSAIAAEEYRKRGERLATYSFEYEDNKHYTPTLFQPNRDDDYAAWLAERLGTEHRVLTAPTEQLASLLPEAARMRDMPGQADVDSSLLYFCGEVKRRHTVALSGECADEIFGGYPWFYRKEMLARDFFPWIHNEAARPSLFIPEVACINAGRERLREMTRAAITSTPLCGEESEDDRTARIATHLSVNYFMTNLLARKDRMSMACALEVRVPFADHRILEYVYNVPWHIKFRGGVEKALLRGAMQNILPERILHRKKSPYPKTHNPRYEALVKAMLEERLASPSSRLAPLLDRRRLDELLSGEDITWFGQLMARPQLIAWLVELDAFLEEYKVEIV